MSVRTIKLNEFGKELLLFAGVDISGASTYTVRFLKPDGTEEDRTAILGTEERTEKDINCQTVTLPADFYATYVIEQGLIDQKGCWAYRLLAPGASESIPGEWGNFKVVD